MALRTFRVESILGEGLAAANTASPRKEAKAFLGLVKARFPVSNSILRGLPVRETAEILDREISR